MSDANQYLAPRWPEDDDETTGEEETQEVGVVSIVQRADYGVVDEDAVMAAAREAWVRNHPGSTAEDAEENIDHLGAALYELAQADGWASLEEAPGLVPLGSVAQALLPVSALELSGEETPDTTPNPGFGVDGAVIYTEENIYR